MSLRIENIKASPAGEITLKATLRPTAPFDFKNSLNSLKVSGASDLYDTFGEEGDWLERPVKLNNRHFLLKLTAPRPDPLDPLLELTLKSSDEAGTPPNDEEANLAITWASRRFNLAVNMEEVREALSKDRYGEELVAKYWPYRAANLPSTWEGLLKTIIGNQIFPGLAVRLLRATVELYGELGHFEGKEYRYYPTPESLAAIVPQDLLGMRFSRQKARYLPGIAQAVLDNAERYNWEKLRQASAEEAISILDELPGVGPWTAHYVAMRGLPHQDVFVDEKGLQKQLAVYFDRPAGLSPEEAAGLMRLYSPYRSFACYYSYMRMYSV